MASRAIERMWAQALGRVATAEEAATQLVQRLQSIAGWSQDEVRRQVAELTGRLSAQRRELERGVEEGVRRALVRIRVPRREELQALSARLEAASHRIERLARHR